MATVSIKNLASAIYDSTRDKSGEVLEEYLARTVQLIKEKNLMSKSDQILKILEEIIDNEEKILRAKVSTKSKLSDKQKKELEELIKERYKAKETAVKYQEDEELLGGIKLEVKDEIINLTLRNKIKKLQDYLIKN